MYCSICLFKYHVNCNNSHVLRVPHSSATSLFECQLHETKTHVHKKGHETKTHVHKKLSLF